MSLSRILLTGAMIVSVPCIASSQDYWQQTNGPEGGEVFDLVLAADGSLLATTGHTLYRSTDEGNSWTMNPSFFSSKLVVSPNGRVLAGANGVSVSTDHGVTWSPSGLAGKSITALGVAANGYMFAAYGYPAAISRSTDNGASWQIDTTGLGSIADQVVSFSTGPAGSILVSYNFQGVFRSTNNGDTWSRLYAGGANGVVFGPTGNIYIARSTGVYRSTNGGTDWVVKNTGLANTSVTSIVSLPNGDLLVSSNSVYRSTNNGDTWQSIGPSVLIGTTHHLLANGGSVFVGVYARGVYRTTDGGASWSPRVGGFRSSTNKSIVVKPGGELVVAGLSDVFLSSDNGASWTPRSGGLNSHSQNINTLAVTPSGSLLAVSAINNNLFRSTNDGVNWTQIITPRQIPGPFLSLPPNIILGGTTGLYRSTNDGVNWASTNASFTQTVNALMRHSDGTLYVGASYGGVHASADTGKTWSAKGLNGQDVRSLVETATGALLAAVNYNGVHRSTNGGTTWTPLSTTTTGNQPIKLYRAGASAILGIFGSIAGDAVFVSTDEGSSWTNANSGLPLTVSVSDFATTPGGRLVAATAGPAGYNGFGVVRASGLINSAESASESLPAAFTLDQNYPNPFNPTTVVRYQITTESDVRLAVYDLLGREVALLVNQRETSGTHAVTFGAAGLASGVYLYRLQAGDFVQSRRMLLVR